MTLNCYPENPFLFFSSLIIVVIALFGWLPLILDLKLINYGKLLSPFRKAFLLPANYAWFIFEFPNILFSLYFMAKGNYNFNSVNFILFLMFLVHYIHRDLIYPLKISGIGRKVPLEITSSAFFFCIFNGYLQTKTLLNDCKYEERIISNYHFYFGIFLYFLGMSINIKSDNILLGIKRKNLENLKKEGKKDESNAYSLPSEFLFKYVYSPHYLGEIIEWAGFGIAGWNFNGFLFAFCTFNILLPRAIANRSYYKTKFKEFDGNRKALIPLLI